MSGKEGEGVRGKGGRMRRSLMHEEGGKEERRKGGKEERRKGGEKRRKAEIRRES